ncbi:MAG TPA: hypothetical protein VFQ61_13485, partial [Polyangiaceae bacterium]|nr:hypothetical protein [Polyangiaceae bacterium]
SSSGGSSSGGTTATSSSSGGSSNGGSSGGGSSSGGASSTTGGTQVSKSLSGDFTVKLTAASDGTPAFTTFSGRANDGPTPPTIVLKVAAESGDCKLSVPDAPFCEKDCGQGVCTAENTCTPYPQGQDLGPLVVKGIGPSPLPLTGTPPNFSYTSGAALPNPPCVEGADFSVEANGLSLTGKCIAPLSLKGADPLPIATGKSLDLTWDPPKTPGQSRVEIYLDIAHHGGKKGQINCDVADTGSFSIPEPLVTQLINLGVAGFPTVQVTRASTAVSSALPNVRLRMTSMVERSIDTGVASCSEDIPCPNGEMCRLSDYTCR